MAKCVRLQRTDTRICAGSLNRKIQIYARAITSPLDPTQATVDYGEDFVLVGNVWAMIKDIKGEIIFNNISIDDSPTHNFYTRFLDGITQENWVVFNNNRYNILRAESLDELNKFLWLQCVVRGSVANAASRA